ncbi:glycosyltransferase family 2 protein [Cytobacillus firmus]|uniref:glycosyltransferase family 2 protein n=1 Tax=Cytobacillus firmus TaxID=1399 RepID=UPI00202FD68B|nr:glycosyltransferase [Cytobacillus firmus]URT70209.1 glycosyltransferase [Cytobacillus firmus]
MNTKISIIVPVYKVEQYLHKCIDSILAQTFKEFELILINDGSPDRCGEICEAYAKKDTRVKVIHKENGGQASARNMGLDIACGKYVGFVDSDDWIEPDMYELLYSLCETYECDIANCTSKIHYKDRLKINGTHSLIIHDKKQAMKEMLKGELYDEVVWTKLIKRSLLEDIRFPVGITYEDTAFTYKLIHKCNKVCCIGSPKYNYIKHEGSTMDNAVKNIKIDAVLVYEEMYKFISKYYSELTSLVVLKLSNSSLVVLRMIVENGDFNQHKKDYYKVAMILNSYFNQTIKLNYLPRNVKILLAALRVHPKIYKFLIGFINKGWLI